MLQDTDGQTSDVLLSAGLDYPGVGPEHAHWNATGRVHYESVTDVEALAAFRLCSELEGIIPALESSHAVAAAVPIAASMPADAHLVINCSGRGDKDAEEARRLLGS